MNHLRRTLEELEGDRWPEPTYDSHVVTECHRLRRVPLGELTTEDLRLLIGQNIGLEHLVPLALERLREDPLAEGDFYPGDLLCALLSTETAFWEGREDLRDDVASIAAKARALADDDVVLTRRIKAAMKEFSGAKR